MTNDAITSDTLRVTATFQRRIHIDKHYGNLVNELTQQCNKQCNRTLSNNILQSKILGDNVERQAQFNRYPIHSDRGRDCIMTCVDRYTDAQKFINLLQLQNVATRVTTERIDSEPSRSNREDEIRELLRHADTIPMD